MYDPGNWFSAASRFAVIIAVLTVVVLGWSDPLLSKEKSDRPFSVDRNVVFCRTDAIDLKADIYIPNEDHYSGLRPGVLMIHGGAWMSGSKINVAVHAMKLARNGYVVMAINYRLAPKHKFPAQLEDCHSALQWFGENAAKYNVDVNRIAAYGYSAGGHLACLMGVKQGSTIRSHHAAETESDSKANSDPIAESKYPGILPRISAIVAGGAPCEFRNIDEMNEFLVYWLGGTRGEIPEKYRQASPTAFVTRDAPPVFFFHGDKDRLVPVRSPKALQKALQQHDVATEMQIVANGGHLGAFFDGDAMDAARRFLDTHLRNVAKDGGNSTEGTAGTSQ